MTGNMNALRIYNHWPRDPHGPMLTHDSQPFGIRTPNLQVWGHDLEDFYLIQRIPNVACVTAWSISMIREFGEKYGDFENRMHDDADDAYKTRVRKPWPLLKLPDGVRCEQEIGAEDEGSFGCLNYSNPNRLTDWKTHNKACAAPPTSSTITDGVQNSFVNESASSEVQGKLHALLRHILRPGAIGPNTAKTLKLFWGVTSNTIVPPRWHIWEILLAQWLKPWVCLILPKLLPYTTRISKRCPLTIFLLDPI